MSLRFFKNTAIFILTSLIFFGAGTWYAATQAPKWAKTYVNQFGQSIGYLIDFNDLQFSVRQPSISVSDLKIIELANQNQLLEVKYLQVSAKWGPLLHQRIELSQVLIDNPRVLADKNSENWNWLRLIAAIQKKFPKKPDVKPRQPIEFLVNDLKLNDGNLKIHAPDIGFSTEFSPLNIELKNTTNIDFNGDLGGLETNYVVSLGDVSLPIPKTDKTLHLGTVILGGDFDLKENKDIFLQMKAKVDQGLIESNTNFYKADNRIESEIQLDRLSLIPFIDFVTPKVPRIEKTGTVTGQLKLKHQGKVNVLDGDIKLEDVSVVPFITLVPTINTIYAKSGGTSSQLKIHYDPESIVVGGNMVLDHLAIFEPDKTSELLGWDTATVSRFDYEKKLSGQKLRIDNIKVDGLKARYVIFGDKSSNFRRMFQPSRDDHQHIGEEKKILTLKIKQVVKTLLRISTQNL